MTDFFMEQLLYGMSNRERCLAARPRAEEARRQLEQWDREEAESARRTKIAKAVRKQAQERKLAEQLPDGRCWAPVWSQAERTQRRCKSIARSEERRCKYHLRYKSPLEEGHVSR